MNWNKIIQMNNKDLLKYITRLKMMNAYMEKELDNVISENQELKMDLDQSNEEIAILERKIEK